MKRNLTLTRSRKSLELECVRTKLIVFIKNHYSDFIKASLMSLLCLSIVINNCVPSKLL